MSDIDKDQRVFARERLTVSNTNKQLTAATFLDEATTHFGRMAAKTAKISVEGSNSIYLDETGGTPSSTRGITLVPGQYFIARGIETMRKLTMQRAGASDADVEVTYYR